MNWKGLDRRRSWPNCSYYHCILLERLKKPRKTSIRIVGVRGRDLNTGYARYEAGVLTTRPRRSVSIGLRYCRCCTVVDLVEEEFTSYCFITIRPGKGETVMKIDIEEGLLN
jgi:hypothetical protein